MLQDVVSEGAMGHQHNITAIFGGIGGLELGLHRHGHRTSLFCENDPEATAVLHRRFPDVPLTFDVRRRQELLETISPKSDLLTAGFPCTDLSQAGRTEGFAGGRSSLIRQVISLLRKRPFANVLIENVPNWRHLHAGEYLTEVVRALERLGYKWAYRTIDALAFGIPQRRLRLFLFATLEGDPRSILFHGDHDRAQQQFELTEAAHGFYWTEGNRGLGWGEDCVPTLKGGSAIAIPSPPAVLLPDLSVITPHIGDAERLQGFTEGWTDADEVLARFNSRPFNQRRRWALVGNAVNVEVSSWIGEQLFNRATFEGDAGEVFESGPWPSAAWFDGKKRRKVEIGTWPVKRKQKPLAKFLKYPGSPLSLRATQGFFLRISETKLRLKPGFKAAIERHLLHMRKAATRDQEDKPTFKRRVA